MNLTTVNVAIAVQLLVGVPLPGGSVRFELTKADINGALVLPKAVCVALPADGSATTAQLWPNILGTQGSQTKVTVLDQAGVEQFSGLATVPNFNCNLHDIITSIAPSTVTDAQAAVNLARAWAVQDPATVDGVDYSAKHHALAAKADRQVADADAAATAADRIQTGQDVVAANAAQAQSSSNMLTATAQASLAQGYAASAGSVAQQDLSGVTGVALHRSPNAIVATTIYDASKDSEGGAWINKVDASYLYEALNGKWLGACASEAAARAVSGAATGDYFQLTTDGKFYKLNAGAGTTEVFRGNTARFPRMAAIVAEASRVVIYDLLSPGRPMWMVFAGVGNNIPTSNLLGSTLDAVSSIAMREAQLIVGVGNSATVNGIRWIDFAKDTGAKYGNAGVNYQLFGGLARRNMAGALVLMGGTPYPIASNAVNAVAMTTMPDAPVDPVTGLQVPTIAVGTIGGVSVIKHDGSVVSSLDTASYTGVTINPYLMVGERNAANGETRTYVQPSKLGASFTNTGSVTSAVAPDFARATPLKTVTSGRGTVGRLILSTARLSLMRTNEINAQQGIAAQITDTHNTGWMAGDIRRCLLSDTAGGVVSAAEKVVNGSFGTGSATGWTPANGGTGTVVAGEYQSIGPTNNVYQDIAVTPGSPVSVGATLRRISGTTNNPAAYFYDGATFGTILAGLGPNGGVAQSVTVTPTQSTIRVYLYNDSNGTVGFTGITAKDAVADRSYKAKASSVFGTLTRAQVGVGSQLVAYSGFSAANYVREAYSADLDFGTGGFDVMPWVSIPAGAPASIAPNLPAANFPVIGSELITNGTPTAATTGWTFAGLDGGQTATAQGLQITCVTDNFVRSYQALACTVGKSYRVTVDVTAINAAAISGGTNIYVHNGNTGTPSVVAGAPSPFNIPGTGTYTFTFKANFATMYFQAVLPSTDNSSVTINNVSIKEVGPSIIVERSAATGAYWRLGVDVQGVLVGEVNDGTTTRTVTSTASYAGAGFIGPELSLATSGSLTLKVNGVQVAQTTGAPLLTLNNASAVLTIGQNFALTAPFPGSISIIDIGATVPTDDASAWMYQQERAMFRDGAQVTLPDSGALVDLGYDRSRDAWGPQSAANFSEFVGLVRTGVTPVPAGAFSKIATEAGVKLLARSTTNPGVDVTVPAQNLMAELLRRGEEAARVARLQEVYDWTGGFTGNLSSGTNTILSVSGLSLPAGATAKGAQVSHANLPGGTFIVDVVGTTIYLSANATGTLVGAQIGFLDFILPPGMEWREGFASGGLKQEGSTKDYTRQFDGFRERARFAATPGATAFVRGNARRIAA